MAFLYSDPFETLFQLQDWHCLSLKFQRPDRDSRARSPNRLKVP